MSKLAGYSLLSLGTLAVIYPFLKKKKVLTNEEILMGKSKESACDLMRIKLNLINSQIAIDSPEYQKLYKKAKLSTEEQQIMRDLNLKGNLLNQQRTELNEKILKECKGIAESDSVRCVVLDGTIKQFSDLIAQFSADLLKPNGSTQFSKETIKILRDKYNLELLKRKNEFSQLNCRDKVEVQNLNESGYLVTQMAEKQEGSVLKSNYNEQYLYIGLGSVVLLTGLYIISKK
jgi:hypothetical protein